MGSSTMEAIVNVRVFDGDVIRPERVVIFKDGRITGLGGAIPADAKVVDGSGATLLPGLIDAHVHTYEAGLSMALKFGVTTELEMQGANTRHDRAHITHNDALADVRSSGM